MKQCLCHRRHRFETRGFQKKNKTHTQKSRYLVKETLFFLQIKKSINYARNWPNELNLSFTLTMFFINILFVKYEIDKKVTDKRAK